MASLWRESGSSNKTLKMNAEQVGGTKKQKKSALTGNRTRVARVAGGHHAPRPWVPCWFHSSKSTWSRHVVQQWTWLFFLSYLSPNKSQLPVFQSPSLEVERCHVIDILTSSTEWVHRFWFNLSCILLWNTTLAAMDFGTLPSELLFAIFSELTNDVKAFDSISRVTKHWGYASVDPALWKVNIIIINFKRSSNHGCHFENSNHLLTCRNYFIIFIPWIRQFRPITSGISHLWTSINYLEQCAITSM